MTTIGIDLGTTNSVAAAVDPARGPETLETRNGNRLTPSIVALKVAKDGAETVAVGEPARNLGRMATTTIASIKRLMGRHFTEPQVAEAQRRLDYEIVPRSDDAGVAVRMGSTTYTPAQISSMILGRVKQDAASRVGEITHAVITVPAYFETAQRTATREAAEAAGLKVRQLVNEPTAAAIAFGMRTSQDEGRRVLVYDLGGGTFDISLLNVVRDVAGGGQFEIVGTEGDNWLGGDDFDHCIVDRIIAVVREEYGVDVSGDRSFRGAAKTAAELAKRDLSEFDTTEIVIPHAVKLADGTVVNVLLDVRRDEFEAMIKPFVARTMTLVEKVLRDNSYTPGDITDVLLVGGATLTPRVQEAVTALFGADKVRRTLNPMECVALGAAILADSLGGVECPACGAPNDDTAEVCAACGQELVRGITVIETTALAVGIAAVDGEDTDVFAPIIPKGTRYPLERPMTRRFRASGHRIKMPVCEGEQQQASRNALHDIIETRLPEHLDPNCEVEISFEYNLNREIIIGLTVPGTEHFEQLHVRQQGAAAGAAAPADDPNDDLERAILIVDQFLQSFERFVPKARMRRIEQHRDEAERAAALPDRGTQDRARDALMNDLDTSGLATVLFYASIAAERSTPREAADIRQAAEAVTEAHDSGNNARRAQAERILSELVNRAFADEDTNVVEDTDGMLIVTHSPSAGRTQARG